MVKAGAMALKTVVPGVLKSVKDRKLLEEDLRRIGCHRLMGRPWGLRMEEMVFELISDKDNRWHKIVCQVSKKWTVKEWRKVYGFTKEGEEMASRTNRFIDSKFSARVNPKDGFAVADCKEARARRVLEFLVPLLYPEKPTRVTITVGNTIFEALSEERPVDWGQVVKVVVQRLFSGMGKSKATPICPYVFHMYHSHEILLLAEKKEYRIKEALLKHNMESEREEDPKGREEPEDSYEFDRESLSSREIRKIQKQDFARMKKSPWNKRVSLAAKEPVVKRKTPIPLEGPDRNYQVIAHNLKEIQEREHTQGDLIRALYKRLGNVQQEGLLEAVDNLPTQKKIDELEAKNDFLLEKATSLGRSSSRLRKTTKRCSTSSMSPSPSTRSWRHMLATPAMW